jgi:integrase
MRQRIPKLCRHKAMDKAYVRDPRLSGKQVYLGDWGSKETAKGYARWVTEFTRETGIGPAKLTGTPKSLAAVLLAWLKEQDLRLRRADGSHTGEYNVCSRAADVARECGIAGVRLSELTREHLIQMRDFCVNKGLSRKTVTEYLARILRCLAFAEARDWIDTSLFLRLSRYERLKAGTAPENREMTPIPEFDLKKIFIKLPERWQPIFTFHLFTGCRSENALTIHGSEIDRSQKTWVYRPVQHKGRHRGHKLEILIGPKARKAIKPFLDLEPEGLLFPAKDGGEIRHYLYRQAFERACKAARIAAYVPRQIRHTAASFLVNKGVEEQVIGAILGHRPGTITQRYAKVSDAVRSKVVEKYG